MPALLADTAHYGICTFVCIPILFSNECVNSRHEINVNTNGKKKDKMTLSFLLETM